jgi:hypothetical protein
VHDGLLEIGDSYGTNELLIVTICYDHQERLESYRLIAESFDL